MRRDFIFEVAVVLYWERLEGIPITSVTLIVETGQLVVLSSTRIWDETYKC